MYALSLVMKNIPMGITYASFAGLTIIGFIEAFPMLAKFFSFLFITFILCTHCRFFHHLRHLLLRHLPLIVRVKDELVFDLLPLHLIDGDVLSDESWHDDLLVAGLASVGLLRETIL